MYWAEDDADDRFLIRQVLSELASAPAVTFFEDGQALLEGLALARPDLVVLDNRMPRLGGIPALQAIRTRHALRDARDVPAIMFCSIRLPEEVAACSLLGVSSYVQKPSGFHAFAQAVRDILAQARALDPPGVPT